MSEQEILAEVIRIVEPFSAGERIPVTAETRLVEELDVNSARLIDIVLDAEERFGILISDAAVDRMKTIGDIVRAVQEASG